MRATPKLNSHSRRPWSRWHLSSLHSKYIRSLQSRALRQEGGRKGYMTEYPTIAKQRRHHSHAEIPSHKGKETLKYQTIFFISSIGWKQAITSSWVFIFLNEKMEISYKARVGELCKNLSTQKGAMLAPVPCHLTRATELEYIFPARVSISWFMWAHGSR